MARTAVCETTMGLAEWRAASSVVWMPTCEQSTSTPTMLQSRTTWMPKVREAAVLGSRQPSPMKLRSM